jgi:hypothetical protein
MNEGSESVLGRVDVVVPLMREHTTQIYYFVHAVTWFVLDHTVDAISSFPDVALESVCLR